MPTQWYNHCARCAIHLQSSQTSMARRKWKKNPRDRGACTLLGQQDGGLQGKD
jgi:hypothetical protein